jgi:DNA-binding IclR family transcriptional regulator
MGKVSPLSPYRVRNIRNIGNILHALRWRGVRVVSMKMKRLAELRGIGKSTAYEALQALADKGALRVYAGKYYPVEE